MCNHPKTELPSRLIDPVAPDSVPVRNFPHKAIAMLKHVSLALAIALSCGTAAIAQTDGSDEARIQLLEHQVLQMREDLRRLNIIIADMQSRLNEVGNDIRALQRGEKAVTVAAKQECLSRLDGLRKKRDNLKSLGLKDGHPDIANLTGLIASVSKECDNTR